MMKQKTALMAFLSAVFAVLSGFANAAKPYCIIDLSGGTSAARYPVTYLTDAPAGGWTDDYKTTKLVLKRIPAGTFTMGSPTSEAGRFFDEPQHKVALTQDFWMGIFEVTQKQYALVMGTNPSHFSGEKCPVEQVSYNMICAGDASFMAILRAKTGLPVNLPTEAQWEYACRAGTTTAYSYGADADGDYMWYNSNAASSTHEVGLKMPNAWGLYDMHGNVYERCLDWYTAQLVDATDPTGPASGSNRIVRGGAWMSNAATCRSAIRDCISPTNVNYLYGFRLCCGPISPQGTVILLADLTSFNK